MGIQLHIFYKNLLYLKYDRFNVLFQTDGEIIINELTCGNSILKNSIFDYVE